MKRLYIFFLSFVLLFSVSLPVYAELATSGSEGHYFVMDHAELLSQREAKQLEQQASKISQLQQCDVVILTVNGIGGQDPSAYASDYFDDNGYGQGTDRNGVLLLLDLSGGNWSISARGGCRQIFTDNGISYLWNGCRDSIKKQDYAKGLTAFLQRADTMLSAYNGTLSDADLEAYHAEFNAFLDPKPSPVKTSVCALGIGLLLAFLPAAALRAQLKSVRPNYSAANYTRPESMQLDVNRDRFLYSNTTSRVLETQRSSSGGGSTTHISSSGASHNVGGGKI